MLSILLTLPALRLFGGQFLFSRIDLYQQRVVWSQSSESGKWEQKFLPAYTLTALDVRHDLVHVFDVQTATNAVYKADWSIKPSVNADLDQKESYKKKVYYELKRWFRSMTPKNISLQCDLPQVEELIAWSQVNDL